MSSGRDEPGDPLTVATALAGRFEDVYHRPPAAVFASPGRVNLIGEHTDYNGGLCLPMALPHATYAAVGPGDDGRVRAVSLQQDSTWTASLADVRPGTVSGWPAYVGGVLWALLEDGVAAAGLDLMIDGRVPLGAGLSSSAALECAVALAACAVADEPVDDALRRRLVTACMRAEREVAGAPTGGMDQTVALFAHAGHALLLDCRDWSTRQVRWAPDADVELLVVDTKAAHALTDGGYASRRRDCEDAARLLGVGLLREVADRDPDAQSAALDSLDDARLRRRVLHVVTEIERVRAAVGHLEAGDLESLGRCFVASHESLRDDYEVSCAELDVVVETALAHGALGARMTGGGFGGSAVVLVRRSAAERVEAAVRDAFTGQGWAEPGVLAATPSDGARQVLPAGAG
jgi:galactokinase